MVHLNKAISISDMGNDVPVSIKITLFTDGQFLLTTVGAENVTVAIGFENDPLIDVEDQRLFGKGQIGKIFEPLPGNSLMLNQAIRNQLPRQCIQRLTIVNSQSVVKVEADCFDLSKTHRPIGEDGPLVIENRSPDRHGDHVEPMGILCGPLIRRLFRFFGIIGFVHIGSPSLKAFKVTHRLLHQFRCPM